MNIRIFNRTYPARRFGEQRNVQGYLVSDPTDFTVNIHLHPLGSDQNTSLSEGERKIKRLEGHGEVKLITADQTTNRKGDMVYYYGDWYECISCVLWDHTLLSHYNYQFVSVPPDGSGTTDLAKPIGGDEA